MKPLLPVFFLLALSLQIASAATLLVDNDPTNQTADFHSLTEAVSSAEAGDTIMVMPSAIRYPSIIFTKSVNLIEPGFGGQELFGTSRDLTAELHHLTFTPGVSGVSIMGFRITGICLFDGVAKGTPINPIDNILLYRNFLGSIGIQISQNTDGILSNFFVINCWIECPIKLSKLSNDYILTHQVFGFKPRNSSQT
ncbi:MAG TPA: hypothetical protein EYQ50_18060 [Verrucomicrobiales bacterium]|nr:hypothetical protein [Verrucomicrobiales bacterium]